MKVKFVVESTHEIMNFLISASIALTLCTSMSLLAQKSAVPLIQYRCSPCGCADDGKYFDNPGYCPSCNMELIPVLDSVRQYNSTRRISVGILLFDGADIMDVTGPWCVFEHAGLQVFTVARNSAPLRIGMSMELKPDFTFDNVPQPDIIVLPGGGPAENQPDEQITNWLNGFKQDSNTLFSVCSGAFLLGRAGYLDNCEATTFASLIPALANEFPSAHVRDDVKFTRQGRVITSAGLSSGIDAAFEVIAKYYGHGRAQDIANHMEYQISGQYEYARSQLADYFILPLRSLAMLFSKSYISSKGDHTHWQYQFIPDDKYSDNQILKSIHQELSKMTNWKTIKTGKNTFKGTMINDRLGSADIQVKITKSGDERILIVEAYKTTDS